jgi:hypothetical protein
VGAAKRNRRTVEPTLRRRNIVTQGINLIALRHWRFRLAESAEIPGSRLLGHTGPYARVASIWDRSSEEARFGRHGPRVRLVTRGSAGPGQVSAG